MSKNINTDSPKDQDTNEDLKNISLSGLEDGKGIPTSEDPDAVPNPTSQKMEDDNISADGSHNTSSKQEQSVNAGGKTVHSETTPNPTSQKMEDDSISADGSSDTSSKQEQRVDAESDTSSVLSSIDSPPIDSLGEVPKSPTSPKLSDSKTVLPDEKSEEKDTLEKDTFSQDISAIMKIMEDDELKRRKYLDELISHNDSTGLNLAPFEDKDGKQEKTSDYIYRTGIFDENNENKEKLTNLKAELTNRDKQLSEKIRDAIGENYVKNPPSYDSSKSGEYEILDGKKIDFQYVDNPHNGGKHLVIIDPAKLKDAVVSWGFQDENGRLAGKASGEYINVVADENGEKHYTFPQNMKFERINGKDGEALTLGFIEKEGKRYYSRISMESLGIAPEMDKGQNLPKNLDATHQVVEGEDAKKDALNLEILKEVPKGVENRTTKGGLVEEAPPFVAPSIAQQKQRARDIVYEAKGVHDERERIKGNNR